MKVFARRAWQYLSFHWHLVVLIVGLPAVGVVWWLWISAGMHMAHRAVADHTLRAPTLRITDGSVSSAQSAAPRGVAASAVVKDSAEAPEAAAVSRIPSEVGSPSGAEDKDPVGQAFTQLGQTGDAFGGLNALLTGIAGVFVLWAGTMQYLSLHGERKHRKLQEFESLFFRLLDLTDKAASLLRGPTPMRYLGRGQVAPTEPKQGPAALNAQARVVANATFRNEQVPFDASAQLVQLAINFVKVYDSAPSRFGPYYRLLFQLFKHIADADHLDEDEKLVYANIARGQLSEGAVFMLALNGLTPQGHAFVPLIERFGLLEHMHAKYRKDYGPALRLAYRERAFLGSRERALPQHTWDRSPLLAEDHCIRDETERYTSEDLEVD